MPSIEFESARFTSVGWVAVSGGLWSVRGWAAGVCFALLAVAALFADDVVASREPGWFLAQDAVHTSWLPSVSAGLFARYAAVAPSTDAGDVSRGGLVSQRGAA